MDKVLQELNQSKLPELVDSYDAGDQSGWIDSDEEMPRAEIQLAEDAQWKIFQKNTFTRWTNEHLKQVNLNVIDLQNDFSDGLRLIALVEVLSGKKFKHANRKPHFRTQKLENVTMVLKYLEEIEGLKLVNIDSTDIVDCRLKLILGLIWTLILHYSILMPAWEGEEEFPSDEKGKGPTPKQRLLAWINQKMPDVPIKNFTHDWNSGIALGALVDACAPGLCPDWPDWDHREPQKNASEAMNAAEQWLDVAKFITPEEIINPELDEKAVMTYLSQFPNTKLKPGAPLRPRVNPARVKAYGPGLEFYGNTINSPARFIVETFSAGNGVLEVLIINPKGGFDKCEVIRNNDKNLTYSCVYMPTLEGEYRVVIKFSGKELPNSPWLIKVAGLAGDAKLVFCSGPGVDSEAKNAVGKRTWFTINTERAGNGLVDCQVRDPNSRVDTIKPRISKQDENGNFLVEYTPKELGRHEVEVFFAGYRIPSCPYPITVSPPKIALPDVPRTLLQKPKAIVKPSLNQEEEKGNISGSLHPNKGIPLPGLAHLTQKSSVPVLLKSDEAKPIESSERDSHPGNAYATGRGIQARGIRVNETVTFHIHTERAGDGTPVITILNNEGITIPVTLKKISEHLFEATYVSQTVGLLNINVIYNGVAIQRNPFKVHVGPTKRSNVRVFGPGLTGGIVKQPCVFTVVCNNETGGLGFAIEGPCEAQIECSDNGDGSAQVTYYVSTPGSYAINISSDDDPIPGSPFIAEILPETIGIQSHKAKAYGLGLETNPNASNILVGLTTEFFIELGESLNNYLPINNSPVQTSSQLLKVECHDSNGEPLQVNVETLSQTKFRCTYCPKISGVHTVDASLLGAEIKNLPARVAVITSVQTDKVQLYGPGLEGAIRDKPTSFTVDLRKACRDDSAIEEAENSLKVFVTDEKGNELPVKLIKNGKGLMTIEYNPNTPTSVVCISVSVCRISVPVGKAPIKVPISPGFDINQVRVTNLEPTVHVGKLQQFMINTEHSDAPKTVPNVFLKLPGKLSAPKMLATVEPISNGFEASYTPNSCGPVQIFVEFEGVTMNNGSPYQVQVVPSATSIDLNSNAVIQMSRSSRSSLEPSVDAVRAHKEVLEQAGIIFKPKRIEQFRLAPGQKAIKWNPASIEPHQELRSRQNTPSRQMPGKLPQVMLKPITNDENRPAPIKIPVNQPEKADKIPTPQSKIPTNHILQPVITPVERQQPRSLFRPQKEKVISNSKWPQAPGTDHAASKIVAYGPGLEKTEVSKSSEFTIDFGKVPLCPISVNLEGPQQAKMEFKNKDDSTIEVIYETSAPGRYAINVIHDSGCHIRGSPFFVQAYPKGKVDLNVSSVYAYGEGLQGETFKDAMARFMVNAQNIDKKGDGEVLVRLVQPDGRRLACNVKNMNNGLYQCTYSPVVEGPHQVEITYEGVAIPGTPHNINVIRGNDPSRIKVYGPGVCSSSKLLHPNENISFNVDIASAGPGSLSVSIEGPGDAPISCVDNRDGTYTVEYIPTLPGNYDIHIKYDEKTITGSPFRINVRAKSDPNQVKCFGPGLNPDYPRVGQSAKFTVDASTAGDGIITAILETPGCANKPIKLVPVGSGKSGIYEATYIPEKTSPPISKVSVMQGDVNVPGSPFLINVKPSNEVNKVRVYGTGVDSTVPASLSSTFTVDAREAGSGELSIGLVDSEGISLPIHVVSVNIPESHLAIQETTESSQVNTGLLSCTYEPFLSGPHKIQVSFDNKEVPNSPFHVDARPCGRADLCQIQNRINETVNVNQEVMVRVDTSKAGSGQLMARIWHLEPNTNVAKQIPIDIEVMKDNPGIKSIYFIPKSSGVIRGEIRHGGQLIPGGSFTQKVVKIDDQVQSFASKNNAQASSQLSYHPVEFRLPCMPLSNTSTYQAIVIKPNGTKATIPVEDHHDGTLSVKHQPDENGMHELHVMNVNKTSGSNMPLPGSPYRFFVDSISTGKVTAHGPGLSYGVTGQEAEFTIITRDAGGGGLSLSIEGPSKVDIRCHDNGDGTCTISYVPLISGEYTVSIKFHDQDINGSPFTAKVTGDSLQRSQVSLGNKSHISLGEYSHQDIGNLTASVETPSKRNEQCVLKRLPSNRLGISFTPHEIGEHIVSVYCAGAHIVNSPFKIYVSPQEIGDSSRVRVNGTGIIHGNAGVTNEFVIDTREAGYAGLSISIEGPSKAEIDCHENPDGTCLIVYEPSEPGTYLANIKFGDKDVPGSPFIIPVDGQPSTREHRQVNTTRMAPPVTQHVGNECEMRLKISDININNLHAEVIAPSREKMPCTVLVNDQGQFIIRFVPTELGIHTVYVYNKGINLPGSPFQFTVGPLQQGGASKVRVAGGGIQRGSTNMPNEFFIYTREAGDGPLSVAVEGPSKAEINFEDYQDGSCGVSWNVDLPGEYLCSVKFAEEHVPFSPFRVYVQENVQNLNQKIYSYANPLNTNENLTSNQTMNMQPTLNNKSSSQIGRPIAFTCHCNLAANQMLRAIVESPSGSQEEAIINSVEPSQYAIRFIPKEYGPHLIHVCCVSLQDNSNYKFTKDLLKKFAINGSPFRIDVEQHTSDPAMVHAEGEGLTHGRVGVRNNFFVNTTNAGCGTLNVTVDGPSKVRLTCKERDDGYEFYYIASAPGQYTITIKYGGNFHIIGSPFVATIIGDAIDPELLEKGVQLESNVTFEAVNKTTHQIIQKNDITATQVQCSGLGIKKAYLNRLNQFIVDASSAELDTLLVGVTGPKNYPIQEVIVKHLQNNQFSVNYTAEQPGQHVIIVKWGDNHIPGSPFIVNAT